MKICGIYGLVCPLDNEIRYIGKTIDIKARIRTHKYSVKKKIKKGSRLNHKDNWIKKLLDLGIYDKVSYVMIETYNNVTNEFLYEREQDIIKIYKTKGYKLTNGCDGGAGVDTKSLKKLWDNGIYDYSNMNHKVYYMVSGSNKITKFLSLSKCIKKIGISRSSIIKSINDKIKIHGIHMFSDCDDINENDYVDISNNAGINTRKSIGIKLTMINVHNKNMKNYESVSLCATANNIDKTNIIKCLNNKTVYHDNIFVYDEPDDIDIIINEYKINTKSRNLSGTTKMCNINKIPIKIVFNDRELKFDSVVECSKNMKIKQSTIKKYKDKGILYKNKFYIESF